MAGGPGRRPLDLVRATARLAGAAATLQGQARPHVDVDPWHVPDVDADGTIRLSPAWLGRVWAQGAATIDGRLVLDLDPATGTARLATAAGARPAQVEEVPVTPTGRGVWAAAGYAVG